jgi:isoleucyl-tRNA synthetase
MVHNVDLQVSTNILEVLAASVHPEDDIYVQVYTVSQLKNTNMDMKILTWTCTPWL